MGTLFQFLQIEEDESGAGLGFRKGAGEYCLELLLVVGAVAGVFACLRSFPPILRYTAVAATAFGAFWAIKEDLIWRVFAVTCGAMVFVVAILLVLASMSQEGEVSFMALLVAAYALYSAWKHMQIAFQAVH